MSRCLLAAVCAVSAAGSLAAARDGDEEKKRVPLYTNEDLRRVSPYRDETGVSSPPADAGAAPVPSPERHDRDERYWRREAERLRDRLRPLRERVAELSLRIEERRRQPRRGIADDPQRVRLERRRQWLEERIRELESRLEERARRERALPGWLR